MSPAPVTSTATLCAIRFLDFVKKAEESGPDSVAVVYLSGYAMQLAGENYFIPVDTTI
jgi:uncharacterized caspase-like protein